MAKIAPVSTKYMVVTQIEVEGTVSKPDVIGAVFGQTEGLLGSDLELRELQKSGRIGRIDVELNVENGKTTGEIILPSSLDKTKTAIVAAALETIDRIGPCDAKLKVKEIRDVRLVKRDYVADRAKELLRRFVDNSLPDSGELMQEVQSSVAAGSVVEYGPDRVPAGPDVDTSDEVIVVEGRADVLNLLKQGFKNVISLEGTTIPRTIVELSKKKKLTLFLDGDRGGDLILQAAASVANIYAVARAPDGKEVEELMKKEIHQALRAAKPLSEYFASKVKKSESDEPKRLSRRLDTRRPVRQMGRSPMQRISEQRQTVRLNPKVSKIFKDMVDSMVGTRGANILDQNLNILGKVPVSELSTTLYNMDGAYAVVFDGETDEDILNAARKKRIRFVVAMSGKKSRGVNVIFANEL